MFQVQKKQCETCIYRLSSPLDLQSLEAQVADPHMQGHFRTYRVCHHAQTNDVCCRGFWNRHKDKFDLGQLAQRLKLVKFVTRDGI